MDDIKMMILFLQSIIGLGGGARILFCLVVMPMEEDSSSYKVRIRNLLIFIAIAECIGAVVQMLLGYFGG